MELTKLTACQAADKIRKKEISVPELTYAYLDKIIELNKKIGAYITVCGQEAEKQADIVQKKFDKNEELPLIAGIPAGINDNICTSGVLTSCGSRMLSNFVPPYDATVIKKLSQNHAVLLGKLNMDEFAMGSSNETSWYGQVKNPWDPERVPGGSGGGAAAAVASKMACFALGSDTGGSARLAASFCGVVGLRPTYGTVSRYGLVAFASSMDQAAPVTRDVADCAAVMNVIAGYDPLDSISRDSGYEDYTSFLENDVKGLKIGLPKEYFSGAVQKEVKEKVLDAAKVFESLGAEIEEISLPLFEYALPAYYIISSAEASSNLAQYDGIKYGYRAQQFEDLVDLYKKSRGEGFGEEVKRRILFGTYVLGAGNYDVFYNKALKVKRMIFEEYQNAYQKVDIILGPTAPSTAFKIGEKTVDPLDMYLIDAYTVPVNLAGLCAISLPCGFDSSGLPVGMQLIGKPYGEGTILRAAFTYEKNTGGNGGIDRGV
ncbi:MAG: Asp-tRNA(Asn)/Glu-tRNA(Gln) amidotransferase subunit GatA [Clostridiaceae bacterium]|nr:Asp-tRNA(Asn)/Glu-tRNA(Gln) amidotransferase subunit GatA [Clostridiaceae bacterium]